MEASGNDDLVKGGQVAEAGIEAAATQPSAAEAKPAAKRAIRQTAKRVQMELSDEDAAKIADALVDAMDQRGAFDAPPEPVTAPAGAAPQPQQAPAQPRKTSWAERFRSS